jgi:hypothetical protein
MKTQKSQSEISETPIVKRRKRISSVKKEPTEEEIREKANEIYLQRIERDEYNTAENDWIEAEKSLRDSN